MISPGGGILLATHYTHDISLRLHASKVSTLYLVLMLFDFVQPGTYLVPHVRCLQLLVQVVVEVPGAACTKHFFLEVFGKM
jgi:hypothetical protein